MLFGFLAPFDNLLADFPHAFPWQPFSAVTRVITSPRFVLLEKADRTRRSELTEQGFESNRADFAKS